MTSDFAQLYLQLGIRNDCSLEEFKQACRRRIRQQHPDRNEDSGSPEATQAALAELLGLYAKALRFHRRHGRLPGSIAGSSFPPPAGSNGLHPAAPVQPRALIPRESVAYPPADPLAPAPRSLTVRHPALMLAAAIAAFTAFIAWNESKGGDPAIAPLNIPPPAVTQPVALPAAPTYATTTQAEEPPAIAPPRLIEIGMDAVTVRALQGDPMQTEGSEWTYGPSWIRFEDERVIDWYSSPLHQLKTKTTSP
ncbi:hypothetical protein DT603_07895 [Pseudoxanthomonas gei]|uniref:J domain-containing protein n=1 Tax=Pseudoxanthomonas gei TaxID=1383030 RepID=A0ABX0AB33_9GAMM|nr:J domain-containing protein [Pseudoxanthomonas gei]NDK38762.1 hypothetical protein [Pseudoxanthomonas gei]